MKKLIAFIILSTIILFGCSKDDKSNEELIKEIARLTLENEALRAEIELLKDEINAYKNTNSDEAEEASDELSINKGLFILKNNQFDVTLEYTIEKYGYMDSYIYQDLKPVERTTEGKFLVLEIYIDNIGKGEFTLSTFDTFVIDTKGREFKCEKKFKEDKSNLGGILKPGFNIRAYYIFEVTRDFEIDKFAFSKNLNSIVKVDLNELEESVYEFN